MKLSLKTSSICIGLSLCAWGAAPTTQQAFPVTRGPAEQPPATQPSRVPRAKLPPAQLRQNAADLPMPMRNGRRTRPIAELQEVVSAQATPPSPVVLPEGPRYSEPPQSTTWLPLSNLLRLRVESPVRAHEPVLDPMGGSKMSVLPVFRTQPAAAHLAAVPDPLENEEAVKLRNVPADEDPPAPTVDMPGRPTMPPLPVPPTTRPSTQPAAK